MIATRLDNGNISVPIRVEDDNGVIGDSTVELSPDDIEYEAWNNWLNNQSNTEEDEDVVDGGEDPWLS
jgi:hypothetical protein